MANNKPNPIGARIVTRLALVAVILAVAYFSGVQFGWQPAPQGGAVVEAGGADAALATAFEKRQSLAQVQGAGEVVRLLAEDDVGSRHQKFIVQLASGQKLLVAHNIDLADRVAALKPGDAVEFRGEYEWNTQGGVIHWTHRDPQERHAGGWIKHKGRTYE